MRIVARVCPIYSSYIRGINSQIGLGIAPASLLSSTMGSNNGLLHHHAFSSSNGAASNIASNSNSSSGNSSGNSGFGAFSSSNLLPTPSLMYFHEISTDCRQIAVYESEFRTNPKSFELDYVYAESTSQYDLYSREVKPLIDSMLNGVRSPSRVKNKIHFNPRFLQIL